MRILALAIVTAVAGLTLTPAAAQTYGGNYPFCMEYYQWGGSRNIECGYSSMAQCQGTASGLSAMCMVNPYYANARAPREPSLRQPRRSY